MSMKWAHEGVEIKRSSFSCSVYHVPLSASDVLISRNSSPAALSFGVYALAKAKAPTAILTRTILRTILIVIMLSRRQDCRVEITEAYELDRTELLCL